MKVHDYAHGWYLKAPYTANNMHYVGRGCLNLMVVRDELIAAIEKRRSATFPFPYLLLQPRVPKPKEFKVIVHNGICKYFHQRGMNSYYTPRQSSPIYKVVMEFANEVYDELKTRSQAIILDGLVRIDIMQVQSSKFVVNEIEGVDSNYSSTNPENEVMTQNFLKQHWAKIIKEKLQS